MKNLAFAASCFTPPQSSLRSGPLDKKREPKFPKNKSSSIRELGADARSENEQG